jgi:hypothetical protein
MTIEERKVELYKKREINLAVEGKSTNLRLWIGFDGTVAENKINPPNTIFMRLDKMNEFDAPLSSDCYGYLMRENKALLELLRFGFKSSIENLDEILKITENLKEREKNNW